MCVIRGVDRESILVWAWMYGGVGVGVWNVIFFSLHWDVGGVWVCEWVCGP